MKIYQKSTITSLIAFLTLLLLVPNTSAQVLETLTFAQSDYKNIVCTVTTSNCANPEGGVTFMSGSSNANVSNAPQLSVGFPGTETTKTGFLVQSSFGHPTARHLGWGSSQGVTAAQHYAEQGYGFVQQVQTLFESYYQNSDPSDPRDIYLGFDFILTNDQGELISVAEDNQDIDITLSDGTTVDSSVIFRTEEINAALQSLYTALQIDPYMTISIDDDTTVELRDLILDITYFQNWKNSDGIQG